MPVKIYNFNLKMKYRNVYLEMVIQIIGIQNLIPILSFETFSSLITQFHISTHFSNSISNSLFKMFKNEVSHLINKRGWGRVTYFTSQSYKNEITCFAFLGHLV